MINAGKQTTLSSRHDEPFTLKCEGDKVLTMLKSNHFNDYEDRVWVATCTHFKGTRVNPQRCNHGLSGQFINPHRGKFKFQCNDGTALTAIYSEHSNDTEDRRFKFECCELMIDEQGEAATKLTKTDWGAYENSFDGALKVAFNAAGLCGVSSYHHNRYEDRRFRFKSCAPGRAISRGTEHHVRRTPFDSVSRIECPGNSVVTSVESHHNDRYEDRMWTYQCGSFDGWVTDMSFWTDWVNHYDKAFDFECGDQHVITGILSYHQNRYEDRLFKFKCSRWREYIPPVPLLSRSIAPISAPPITPITSEPTSEPTPIPSHRPTISPSLRPTVSPSCEPTSPPSRRPTTAPSLEPTIAPSRGPTVLPSHRRTVQPTSGPAAPVEDVLPTKDDVVLNETEQYTIAAISTAVSTAISSPSSTETPSPSSKLHLGIYLTLLATFIGWYYTFS